MTDFLEKINQDFNLEAQPREGCLLFDQEEDTFQRWGPNRQRYRWKGKTLLHNGKNYQFGTFLDLVTGQKKTYKSWKHQDLDVKSYLNITKKVDTSLTKEINSFEETFYNLEPAKETHPYFKDKKISMFGDIREDKNQNLCVPSYSLEDNPSVIGIQTINTMGKKCSYKGSTKGYFSMGDLTPYIYICEGYSTGCTIHELTGSFTVMTLRQITFGKSSEEPIEYFAKKYPKNHIIICIDNVKPEELKKLDIKDNDEFLKKVAYKYRHLLNVHVIRPIPAVDNPSKPLSDFNDLFFQDPYRTDKQLKNLPDAVYISPLGHVGKTCFLYSSYNREIHKIEKTDKAFILPFIAPKNYWDNKFIYCNPNNIINELQQLCGKEVFDYRNYRFAGIYNNNRKICINDGYVTKGPKSEDKTYLPIGEYPSLKKYPPNEEYWHELKMLTFEHMNFNTINDIFTIFAWMTLSNIVTALPFRFNMDFTGESSAGKSWFFENISYHYMKPFNMCRVVTSQDTKATIKDDFKKNKNLLVFLENESDMSKDRRWVYDLSRECSSKDFYTTKFEGGRHIHIPVALQILSLYNAMGYRTKADENRVIKIPFIINDNKRLAFSSISHFFTKAHLKKLSLHFTFKIINNWEIFLKKYEYYFNMLSKDLNNHRSRAWGELCAAIEVTKMAGHEEILNYLTYVKSHPDNHKTDEAEKESDLIIEALRSLPITSSNEKQTRTLQWLLNNTRHAIKENSVIHDYYRKLFDEYKIKAVKRTNIYYLDIWRESIQVKKHLLRSGLERFVNGFSIVLNNEVYPLKRTSFGTGKQYTCCSIPIKRFLNHERFDGFLGAISHIDLEK